MSTVGTLTKLATDAAGKAAHAVTHPVATVTTAAGQAKRVAANVIGRHDTPSRTEPEPEPVDITTPDPAAAAEQAVAAEKARAAAQRPGTEESPDSAVTTPAGTTAAGPGYNPDTAESDLHQPDTEPLMDPSLTKKVRSEAETMRKASEPGSE